jgi:hypothetical protein
VESPVAALSADRPRFALLALVLGLAIAMLAWPGGANTETLLDVQLSADATDAREVLGVTDAGSYLEGGLSLADDGDLEPEQRWLIQLWPPGMVAYNALLVTLVGGPSGPVLLAASVIGVVGWTMALAAWVRLGWASRRTTIACLAVLLTSGMFGGFIIREAVPMGDPPGLLLLTTWCLLLWAADHAASTRRAVMLAAAAGVAAAVGAYVRAGTEVTGRFLTIATIALGLAWGVGWIMRRRVTSPRLERVLAASRRGVLVLLVSCATLQVLCLPWRIYRSQNLSPGELSWTVYDSGNYRFNWMSDEYYTSIGADWVRDGVGNTACRVEPVRCQEIEALEMASPTPYGTEDGGGALTEAQFRDETFRVLREHPIAWTRVKAPVITRFWFADNREPVSPKGPAILENAALLAASVASLAIAARLLLSGRFALPLLYGLVVASAGAVVFMLHAETRYLFPIKVAGLVCLPLLVTDLREIRSRSTAGVEQQTHDDDVLEATADEHVSAEQALLDEAEALVRASSYEVGRGHLEPDPAKP